MAGHGLLRNEGSNDRRVVKQRTGRDCGICCIAMATGWTYEETLRAVGDYYQADLGLWGVDNALKRAQIKHKRVGALSNRPALVSFFIGEIAQFNILHMVYWNGREFIDPSNKPKERQKIFRIIEIGS